MRHREGGVWGSALVFVLLSAVALAGGGGGDLAARARKARSQESWGELEKTARRWVAEAPKDPAAHAHLALALAALGRFDEGVAELRAVEAAGASCEKAVRGFGVPLLEVTNAIYRKCWANFDPAFNRKCWAGVFEAFPESPMLATAASRLLMAALKEHDEAAARRFEGYFERRIEEARKRHSGEGSLLTSYARGYLRAGGEGGGGGGEKPLELARRAFDLAWEGAVRKHHYEGPDAPGGDDPARRELCDLDSERQYIDLALASYLAGAFDPDRNPLAAREPEPGAVFEDVTEEAGLAGLRRTRVAVGDFDDDGDPDLCLQGMLLRNEKGKGFRDVSAAFGITKRGSSALFGDYDDDGDLDLLIPAAPHPFLFRNGGKKGGYHFDDVTEAAGLGRLAVEAGPEGAAWLDADGDGRLDFYLAVYESPMGHGHPDLLARNNGDGTFSDASRESGILGVPAMCGRGVAACDFDGDGDQDLYVSNYRLNPNFLFVNDGTGRFTERSAALGVQGERKPAGGSTFGHTIGSCWGDIDGDGDLDLFTANLSHPRFVAQGFSNLSMLYLNPGSGPGSETPFEECRRARGIRFQETHSDPALVDYDNDGDLDLSITCVYEGTPSLLYQNDGTGAFAPVTFRSRAVAFHGWGQAWFDYDLDGDLDLFVASSSGCRLLRNRGNDNHWLEVRLVGKRRNRFGVGARVRLEALGAKPALALVRELEAGRGTSSQDGFTLHFGLGAYAGRVRLSIRWPDTGQIEHREAPVDRRLRVRQVRVVPKRRG